MSIPSITIHLDFGAGGVTGTTETQGPHPIDLAALGASTVIGSGAPPPAVSSALGGIEAAPPAPSPDALGADDVLSLAVNPPAPSPDIPGLGQGAADSGEAPPEPEGEPEGSGDEKKATRGK
jgi:hypothetical protein